MPAATSEQIINELLQARNEAMDVEWQTAVPQKDDDPDTRYRNQLIGNIETLLTSVQQNLSKVGKDDYHIFITQLIQVENSLRDLNSQVNEYCDAANNVAMKDNEDGFVDFPETDEDEGFELLTGDISYELAGKD